MDDCLRDRSRGTFHRTRPRSRAHGRRAWIGVATVVALCCGPAPLAAEAVKELLDKVRDINRTVRHWDDCTQRLALTIRDRRGGERQRTLELFTRKYGPESTRTLLFFRSPPEVRGIGFLQWIEPQTPDRQWLSLPALKRVRQITGGSKRESFVGTDFSYEDLAIRAEVTDWTDEDATMSIVGEEAVNGHTCAIIEALPKDAESAYSKVRFWLGRDDLFVHRYQFEDRNQRLAKTLAVSEVRDVGKVLTGHRLEMQNERSGSRTLVVVEEVKYDSGLTDALFTQRHLEQGT